MPNLEFTAKISSQGKTTIPTSIRDVCEIEKGDYVTMQIFTRDSPPQPEFTAKVSGQGKVTVPVAVRLICKIKGGDYATFLVQEMSRVVD